MEINPLSGSILDGRQQSRPFARYCYKCSYPLWIDDDKTYSSEVLSWRDSQLFALASFVSDSNTSDVPADWNVKMCRGLDALFRNLYLQGKVYSFREWSWLLNFRNSLSVSLPRLESLLRLASIQAVNLTELIIAPEQSCSPRLLSLEESGTAQGSRKSQPKDKWLLASKLLTSLIKSESQFPLPSIASLAKSLDLLPCGMRQHFRELCLEYGRERMRRANRMADNEFKKVCSTAAEYCLNKKRRGERIFVRLDGVEISSITGCSKHISEAAIHIATRYSG